MKPSVQEDFKAYLQQEDKLVPKILAKVEKTTSVHREHLLYALGTVFSLYLILGQRAQFVCNTVGVLYPIWATFRAIQHPEQSINVQWLSYWSVFGALTLVDALIGTWPLYWLIKCASFLGLWLPWFRWAERIYNSVAVPAFTRLWPLIEGEREQQQTQTKIELKEETKKEIITQVETTPAEPRD